jgi:sec-independent protein translocase protein TatB
MEFLGIGVFELLVILVIALLVVGPKRLPEMAAQLARVYRAARRYAADVTKDLNETMKELEQEYDDMKGEWKDVGQGLDEGLRSMDSELRSVDREAQRALEEANRPSGSSAGA